MIMWRLACKIIDLMFPLRVMKIDQKKSQYDLVSILVKPSPATTTRTDTLNSLFRGSIMPACKVRRMKWLGQGR